MGGSGPHSKGPNNDRHDSNEPPGFVPSNPFPPRDANEATSANCSLHRWMRGCSFGFVIFLEVRWGGLLGNRMVAENDNIDRSQEFENHLIGWLRHRR